LIDLFHFEQECVLSPRAHLKDLDTGSNWLERSDCEPLPIQGSCAIGRSADSDLVLNDERVSRRHAIIHSQGAHELWLVDLGSINGTYCNQRRVSQPIRLRDGDSIQIGPFGMVFRQSASHAPGPRENATAVKFKSLPCWLLLADLISSTQLVQRLNTEQLAMVTGTWLLGCKDAIERNGGIINKYLGDGLLVYWPSTEQVPRCLAKALQELRRLQDAGKTPFRFVLHHGRVTMGGMASLGEESLLGQEVNFVFRMEKLAGRLRLPCLLSEAACTQMAQELPVTDAGTHELEGFDGSHRFFRISS
jgi:adenylate cyclase